MPCQVLLQHAYGRSLFVVTYEKIRYMLTGCIHAAALQCSFPNHIVTLKSPMEAGRYVTGGEHAVRWKEVAGAKAMGERMESHSCQAVLVGP